MKTRQALNTQEPKIDNITLKNIMDMPPFLLLKMQRSPHQKEWVSDLESQSPHCHRQLKIRSAHREEREIQNQEIYSNIPDQGPKAKASFWPRTRI